MSDIDKLLPPGTPHIKGNILEYIHSKFSNMEPPLIVNTPEEFKNTNLGNHMYIQITTNDPELLRSSQDVTHIISNLQGVEKVFFTYLRVMDYNKFPLSLFHAPYSQFFITNIKDNFQFDAIRVNPIIKPQIQFLPLLTGVVNYQNGDAYIGTQDPPEVYNGDRSDAYPRPKK